MSGDVQQKWVPGLGLIRSYADVDTTKVYPNVQGPADAATFKKSTVGDLIGDVAEQVKKHSLTGEEKDDLTGHKHPHDLPEDEQDELEPDDGEESIDGQKGDIEMAQPNAVRTAKVKPNYNDKDAVMAQPNAKRTPKVKPSDQPTTPDHPGKTTQEKSLVIYDRESRVYVTKSAVAGTIRRAVVVDGIPTYTVALDNGNMQRVTHDDLKLMTREAESRLTTPPPARA